VSHYLSNLHITKHSNIENFHHNRLY